MTTWATVPKWVPPDGEILTKVKCSKPIHFGNEYFGPGSGYDVGYVQTLEGEDLSNVTIHSICVTGRLDVFDIQGDLELWADASKTNLLYYMRFCFEPPHEQWNEYYEYQLIPGTGIVFTDRVFVSTLEYFLFYIGSDGVRRGPIPPYNVPEHINIYNTTMCFCTLTFMYTDNTP